MFSGSDGELAFFVCMGMKEDNDVLGLSNLENEFVSALGLVTVTSCRPVKKSRLLVGHSLQEKILTVIRISFRFRVSSFTV